MRAATDPALAAYGVTAACRQDIAVAVTEACGNAIRHARASTLEVDVHRQGDRLVLRVVELVETRGPHPACRKRMSC